ncbi:hypothetical protein [Bifidobacterium sp. ESL0732]|uniref:hypothetical protein n=1 Tax=Bifidobacterium sp. ESL0732 TaxID=2983222 RepID=UPI0023F6C5E6|nr:hypothetical protein [Bifidobacterium sp. ESL0732]WEV64331.1 hypothetical protein OZX70_01680 [Bifidobacterium sp. ESL0732]
MKTNITKCLKGFSRQRLKANWILPVSLVAYLILNLMKSKVYVLGLLLAFIVAFVVAAYIPSIRKIVNQQQIAIKLLSFFSALGCCWFGCNSLYSKLNKYSEVVTRSVHLGVGTLILPIVVLGLIALIFVYVAMVMFWGYLWKRFRELNLLQDVTKCELIFYGVVFSILAVYCVVAFCQSRAFYAAGGAKPSDVIYTSDSGILVSNDAYLTLTHQENDLRQPFFALFASPFCGIPYLVSVLFGNKLIVKAILENIVQIAMLVFANFLLAKALRVKSAYRVMFVVLLCSTYSQLLFTVMMEQYIVAYFWIVICIFIICSNKKLGLLEFFGAAGSLLTSFVLIPFAVKNPEEKISAKTWIIRAFIICCEFFGIFLLFDRVDVFVHLNTTVHNLGQFTGVHATWGDKILQFVAFVQTIFIAPSAGVVPHGSGAFAWHLMPVQSLAIVGLIILILVILSAICNHKELVCQVSSLWVIFSFLLLFVVGWGTAENGLILYALYFGWAYAILLFKLVVKIGDILNIRFVVPVVTALSILVMFAYNVHGFAELLSFAITFYPAVLA